MSQLEKYALKYIGTKEIDAYCKNIDNSIDLLALKNHLIGKLGLSEVTVDTYYNNSIKVNK